MIIFQSTAFNICAISLVSSIITFVSGLGNEEFDLQRHVGYRHRRVASITPTNICNTWSKWINDNHPSPSHRTEEEHLDPAMVETLCPKAFGGAVTRFECLDEDNKITFTGNKTSSGWTQIHHCNVTDMYVLCTIDSSSSSQCPDMSLRFYCFCDQITTTTQSLPTAIPAMFPAVTKSTTSPSPSTSTTTTMSTTITSTPWWTDSTTVTFVPLVTTRRTTLKRTIQTPIAVPMKTTSDIPNTTTSQTLKPLVATNTMIPMMFPGVTPTALPPKITTSSTPPTTTSTAMSSTITSTPWWTDSTTITYLQKLTTRGTTKQATKIPIATLPTKSSTAPRMTSIVMRTTPTTKSVPDKPTTDIKVASSNSSVDINHFDSVDGEEDEICYYYEPTSGFEVGNAHVSWWIINLVISILLFCVCCTVLWCMYKRLKKNRKSKASAVQPTLDV